MRLLLNTRSTLHRCLLVATFVTLPLVSASFAGPRARAASDGESETGPGWTQWRGAHRDGRVDGPAWPSDLSGLEPLWRVELGKGYSGAVVAADRVFVVETVRETGITAARVRALRRDTGEEIWRRGWEAQGDVPFFAASHGAWERSTPAYDGRVLYVGDMEEVLHALDGETGEERWAIDFPQQYGTTRPPFGFASSPLLVDGTLYLQAANGLVKVEVESGRVLWRSAVTDDSMSTGGAFSSPILTTLNSIDQVLAFTRSHLTGVDPQSGQVLWQHAVPNFRGMNIVTPSVYRDGVFVSQYRNGSYFFRPGGRAGSGQVRMETAWTNKGSGYMSSPVVIDDHVYQHLGNGRLSSIDLRSGEENWRTRPLGEYWSMVWQGDRILAMSTDGSLRLVRATPDRFELLDEREVAQTSVWGHVAVSGDGVFVRELEAISAFQWTDTLTRVSRIQ